MDSVPTSGDITVGRDAYAANLITGIQQNFIVIFPQPFQPPVDLLQLRADYLQYLRDSYRYLDIKGVQQVQQVTQQLTLTAVYVPLKAHAGHAAGTGRVAGRQWEDIAPGAREALAVAALPQHVAPVPVEVALHTDPAVIVLGDPGSGKSTLLKILALALAEQRDGPLPIVLPLNAYARALQQGERNLQQFLSDYYASRQHKLSRVGELFQQALKQQQAVILLDGLDEVQANRAHVVRLVQDFVAEHVPLPHDPPAAEDTQSPAVVTGNRVVVTSRIVGYDEAPLSGRQWRTYTLTDFSRADIEQFVAQWTLALARSIQGDSEPTLQAAAREQQELLEAIFARPSVERLAANPLLLTILALIKHTGVALPEQRVKLYDLYLQTLIESWNRARSLDQHQVRDALNYEETVQVLGPLALWLRQENSSAGLVTQEQLEGWLTDYYSSDEWRLPRGQAGSAGARFWTAYSATPICSWSGGNGSTVFCT